MGSPSIGTHSGTGVSPLLNRTGCRVWRIVPPTGCSHVTIVSLCTTCSSTRPRRARRRDRDLGLLERCEDLLDGPLLELLDQNRTGDRQVVARQQPRRGVEALVVGHLGMPEHLEDPQPHVVDRAVVDDLSVGHVGELGTSRRCGDRPTSRRRRACSPSSRRARRIRPRGSRGHQHAVLLAVYARFLLAVDKPCQRPGF